MIRVYCTRCKTRFTTSNANAGKTGRCPKCGNAIRVPTAGSQQTPPATEPEPNAPPGAPAQQTAPSEAPSPSAPQPQRPQPHAGETAGAVTPQADSDEADARSPAPPPEQPAPAAAPTPPPAEASPRPEGKSKTVALILCIFLGAMGIHRFYMGAWGYGLLILALNLTCVGSLVFAVVDLIKLATMDEADFQARYSERVVRPFTF